MGRAGTRPPYLRCDDRVQEDKRVTAVLPHRQRIGSPRERPVFTVSKVGSRRLDEHSPAGVTHHGGRKDGPPTNPRRAVESPLEGR